MGLPMEAQSEPASARQPRRSLVNVDSKLSALSFLLEGQQQGGEDAHASASAAQPQQRAPAPPPEPAAGAGLAPAASGGRRKKAPMQIQVDFAAAGQQEAFPTADPATGGSHPSSGSKHLSAKSAESASASLSTPHSTRTVAVTTALASPSPARDPLAPTPRSTRGRSRSVRKYREVALSPVDERLKAFAEGFNEIREMMRAADVWQFTEHEVVRAGDTVVGRVTDRGYRYYRFDVPAGASRLAVRVKALAGDPDLFASFSHDFPTREHHQFRSVREGDDRLDITDDLPEFRVAPLYLAIFGYHRAEYALTVLALSSALLRLGMETAGHCGPRLSAYFRVEATDARQSLVLRVQPTRGAARPAVHVSREHRFPAAGKCTWSREADGHAELAIDPVDRRHAAGWYYVAVEAAGEVDFLITASHRKYPPDASADRAISRAVVCAIARGRYSEAAAIAALDPIRFPPLVCNPAKDEEHARPRVPPLQLPAVPSAAALPPPLHRARPCAVCSAGATERGPGRPHVHAPTSRRSAPAGPVPPVPPVPPRARRPRPPPSPPEGGGLLVVLDSDRPGEDAARPALPWQSAVLLPEPRRRVPAALERIEARYGKARRLIERDGRPAARASAA